MDTDISKKNHLDQLSYLPAYAQYILSEKLNDFVAAQLELHEELDIPMMRFFKSLSVLEKKALGLQTSTEFLSYLANNQASKQIQDAIFKWKQNRLPVIKKDDIVAEDITLFTYLRKKALLRFISDYSKDIAHAIELIQEIDLFLLASETAASNTYINLLKERIDTHSHFIEKITNTSPGIIYVYDVVNNKEIYANKATTEFLGFSPEELTGMGDRFVETLIHPDDIAEMKAYENTFGTIKDGEVRSLKYRIRNDKGEYRWLRTYETVFKRDADGRVTEKIGIAIDVHQQKITADQLQKRERELLEAQEIAQLGSFTWNFNGNSYGSPQTEAILEIDLNDHDAFMDRVHPDDLEKVKTAIDKSFKTGKYECEYRYKGSLKEKFIWTRGVVSFEDGKPVCMHGTVMDTTERQKLIQKLTDSENLYRQAEALTHIGNYSWNLDRNELRWSDELYYIYGLEPGTPLDPDSIRKFNHPDDQALISDVIADSIKKRTPFDFYYRILTAFNQEKILHARGNISVSKYSNSTILIGTAQDVTEKQALLKQLRHEQTVFKQAEQLANIGSWTWQLGNDTVEWTDQMYRIYELPVQSESITFERFLKFVHPQDRPRLAASTETIVREGHLDHSFRIITASGSIKTIHTIAKLYLDTHGNPSYVIGAEQDISQREQLLDKLRKNESIYKQAEELSNMGNWSWDVKNDKLEWTDQLYKIYGLAPQSEPVTIARFLSFVHPDDRPAIEKGVTSIQYEKHLDYTFRIITPQGQTKIIRSVAHVETNEAGEPVWVIGSERDTTEKQILINRLQESERLYKQAQGLAHLGNWSIDLSTNIFDWSDEMYRIYEMEKGQPMTITEWEQFIHPEERREVLAYLRECIETKQIYDRQHRIVLPSGKIKVIHRKAEIICNDQGTAIRMIGTTQDVTQQYQVQQELKENQTFIRKITDATPSIIASYNINTGNYVFISEGLEKLLGYDTKLVMEKGVRFFAEILHPDDVTGLMEKNQKVLEDTNLHPDKNDFIVEFTYRMRHKNGMYRWFHTYGTIFDRNADGRVEHILNISLDVTEQQQATEKIKEQEHFIQQIADASPTILYLFDVEQQSIVYINREIFFVLGYTPEEIINQGKHITELLYHPEDFPLLPARDQSQKQFQQIDSMMQYECRLRNKEQEWQWFLVREIVFKTDKLGNTQQILGAALDISRRKDMERTILQNTLLLEQSNASLEEFAYVASHDLKEPLRKISTFGDRLVASQMELLAPDGKIYLRKIIDASHRMQTMISDLLAISMITGNRSFEPFSLQAILDETLQTLEFKIEQLNAVIQNDPLPEANIVVSQFRQLFQNLLSNSLKFVREGVQPVVVIRCTTPEDSEMANYQLPRTGKYIKLQFIDNGIGFENEFAGKIFAIFQRLHGRSEYEGSGIGLAICKKIVEHHRGIIFATGVPDQGASFTIILPA